VARRALSDKPRRLQQFGLCLPCSAANHAIADLDAVRQLGRALKKSRAVGGRTA
jgi:hypothetical protein